MRRYTFAYRRNEIEISVPAEHEEQAWERLWGLLQTVAQVQHQALDYEVQVNLDAFHQDMWELVDWRPLEGAPDA